MGDILDNVGNVFDKLKKFFEILKEHLILIITTTIVTAFVFAIAVLFFIKPQYQSTTQMIVNQKISKTAEDTQLQGIQQADVQLVNTYKGIITSPAVNSRVQSALGDNKLVKNSKVNVDTQPNSQVFNISVKSRNPNIAAEMANETATVFKKRLKHIMRSSRANVIARAHPNGSPVFPKKSLSILLGIVVGFILGVLLALFKAYSAKTVDDLDYLTKNLGLNDLGIVDDINLDNIRREQKNSRSHPSV